MEVETFLQRIHRGDLLRDQIVHIEQLPERPPIYQDIEGGLHGDVEEALKTLGIERLYSHQAAATP